MAFFRKAGCILARTARSNINPEISLSKPLFLQAIRCMSSKLFIGGLSYSTDDTSLREAFDKYGEVAEARVIVDRETGRSRGFGFVTYSSEEEASAAIQALDQQDLHGRTVRVNFANDRASGGGYRGGYGGGGGGGYGGGVGGYGGGGGGYGNNDGYGGRSYGSGGGGGYGGNSNFSSGVNSYGNDAFPAGGESHTGYGQNSGVAGGVGGNDNFSGGGAGGFGDNFGGKESQAIGGDSFEGNYRDDKDTPDNYADRRG